MTARIREKVKMLNLKIGTDMKYNAFLLTIIAAALSSCMSDKAETLAYEGEQITIRASQEGATETRTTLVDGGTQVYWEPLGPLLMQMRICYIKIKETLIRAKILRKMLWRGVLFQPLRHAEYCSITFPSR